MKPIIGSLVRAKKTPSVNALFWGETGIVVGEGRGKILSGHPTVRVTFRCPYLDVANVEFEPDWLEVIG
jgi:hypothetical protein